MICIIYPPSPCIKFALPIIHQRPGTHNQYPRIPDVLRTIQSSYLPHPFLISLIPSFAKCSSEECNDLHGLAKPHIVSEDATTLVNEMFVQEPSAFNLIVTEPLGDGGGDNAK